MELLALLWIVCVIAAVIIGNRNGEAGSAAVLALLLGPLGLVLVAMSSGNRVPCPACKEMIHKAASICPHCRSELPKKPRRNWL